MKDHRTATRRLAALLSAGLAFLCLASPIRAETITATFVGVQSGTRANAPDGYAGVMSFSTANTHLAGGTIGLFPGLGTPPNGTKFQSFCIQPTDFLQSPDTYTVIYATPETVSSWAGTPAIFNEPTAQAILRLFGTFFHQLDDANPGGFDPGNTLSVARQYAAFQLAIWKLEGVDPGGNSDIDALADAFANYALSNTEAPEATNVIILDAADPGQNQITVIDPVPAPPGIVLAAIGFAGVGFYCRRPRRAVQS